MARPAPLSAYHRPRALSRALLTGSGVLAVAGAAVLLVSDLERVTGARGFLVGILLALVPVGPVVWALLLLDRFEPEPARYLGFAVVWGATVSAAGALLLNSLSVDAVRAATRADRLVTVAVLVAPFVEEAMKGSAVLLVARFRRDEFDGVVDGLVYGGLAGVGFAFTENVLYLGRTFLAASHATAGGAPLVVTVFFLRCVLSPFAHPLFTAATGAGLGVAARSPRRWVRVAAPLGGYLVAVSLHATFNVAAVGGARGFVSTYVVFLVPLFLAGLALAVAARRHEGRLIGHSLRPYVRAGWFSDTELVMLSSVRGRYSARGWAARRGGPTARSAVAAYQAAASELAFLRDRAVRGLPVVDFDTREGALLRRLAGDRALAAAMSAGASD